MDVLWRSEGPGNVGALPQRLSALLDGTPTGDALTSHALKETFPPDEVSPAIRQPGQNVQKERCRLRATHRPFYALAATLFCSIAFAQPRLPASDDEIVARLPNAARLQQLAPLRDSVRAHPEDLSLAVQLARGYVSAARSQDDPRLMGYALATLKPWLSGAPASAESWLVAADAAQYLHQFDVAMSYLDRSLSIKEDAQAQLMRADLLEVRGDLPAARKACAKLAQLTAQEIAIACLSSVASRSGSLQQSFETLAKLRASSPQLPADIDAWILGILADMSDRLGDSDTQGKHLETARTREPLDLKVKAAYADWLLSRGRPAEVLALLKEDEQHDGLLLRLAIASTLTAPDSTPARRLAEAFRDRQALAAGESRHLREQARFLLEVERKPAEAARVALENWQIQREPEDLRLLVRAAHRSGDQAALTVARSWISENHYEDRRLE